MSIELNSMTTIIIALSKIGLEHHCTIMEGSVYFRYDTEDSTPKDNEQLYYSLMEDLRSVNLRIDDPYIEHDCISGDIVFIESSNRGMTPNFIHRDDSPYQPQ